MDIWPRHMSTSSTLSPHQGGKLPLLARPRNESSGFSLTFVTEQENSLNKMFFIAVIVALPVGLGSEVLAQDGIDQPLNEVFQTELVYPQEKGAFQFTSVATFSRPDKNFSNDLTIEYGLTHAWQISLEWESFARKKADNGLMSHGSGDVRIGTKYSFMNIRGSNFHSAIGFELGLPAASAKAQISERQIEYEPYVIVAKDFPNLSRLQLFTQLGLNFAHPVTRSEDSRAVKTVDRKSVV